jgi:diguanylate cyclase (GGDEF)-like protein/PAS domain S-box-containing protein
MQRAGGADQSNMDRASVVHADESQHSRLSEDGPSAMANVLRDMAGAGSDMEQALETACTKLAQSLASAERLRNDLHEQGAELRTVENRLQVTLEMLSEGVLIYDAHGRVVHANNAAARILGMSHDQLLSRHARDRRWKLLHEDGSPWPISSYPVAETLQTGRSHRNVVMGNCKSDDSVIWLSVSSRTALDEHGRPCGAITTFSDITERRIILGQLEHQAHHDQLTNLANRRLFHRELDRSISRAERQGCAVALVYMDLNGFKRINDTLGHRTGDFVLRAIAERLTAATRDEELIARYGGDEFVALLSMLRHPSSDVAAFTERMRVTLSEPIPIEAGSVRVGASLGASIYPHDGRTAEDLLHHADAAMFAMKGRLSQ